jgi:predicted nucleic acid-binding protein
VTKPFVDSNVVLYLLSANAAKADRAQAILAGGAVISVQVLNEVTSVCLRKLKMPWQEIDALLIALKASCDVLPLTVASHEKAVALAKQFQLSFYDAHIVASAALSGATTLMTEDMHAGLRIDTLVLQDPFKESTP